ncbi:MAG TPA: tRNA lysidine(34) synthetase TilS [Pyrinomonadaceae bacterium]|nr:tRNA lysidine(34) synthetase TilS [Pyrinomonadaceae bacterium]
MPNSTHRSRPKLSRFSRNLLEEWRNLELPTTDATIVVAVSGGADSSALLLAVDELIKYQKLAVRLVVAHLDHGLRPESSNDTKWVKSLAKDLGHVFVSSKTNLTTRSSNLEQKAREARYEFLFKVTNRRKSQYVLTAHTLDDQAETILLRLLRGSAAEGLAGTPSVRPLRAGSAVKLVRPLLSWAHREETEEYCQTRGVDYRTDDMNEDETFTRVRVRKQLLPLMKSFNSRIVEGLSRTALLLSEDASVLANQAETLLEAARRKKSPENETGNPLLDVITLLAAPTAVRRRVLRQWILRGRGDLRRLERVHLLAVEKLLDGVTGGRVAELPGGMKVTRRRGMLELSGKKRLKKRAVTPKIRKHKAAGT